MSVYLRIAPGLKVRVTLRGARWSFGPRIARFHVGRGGRHLDWGRPVSLYRRLRGRRRQSRKN